MFFNAFHVAGVLACLVAVINAAPQAAESSAPPPQVSTFRAPKVINTVLPVSPFLTVTTTTITWIETISATATASSD
ncbi:hypothetical protein C8Q75DRAFT_806415 [Abortiporus biennis]|nr:hypothetical protein C8Q75DRAFT_806415 [Abortiporus biennis]